ncbi:hypothetical protein B0A55_03549 [Friedmanniomyces simplex]|uniref:F-box domain-containing protein n=1 Tax=Friedmanniomyces simplex TaxID=329884 RepID=A0A4U0XXK1_9PEZI|nr:hypothetical protein B0A55_03549 [Friedmanniomyces simplex]
MSATANTGSGCRLLNLPAELREPTFHLALTAPIPVNSLNPSGITAAALTQTCRQLRHETINTFFAHNTFELNVTATTTSTALTWLRAIELEHIQQFPKLIITFSANPLTQQQRDDAARARVTHPWPPMSFPDVSSLHAAAMGSVIAKMRLQGPGRDFAQAFIRTDVVRERIKVDDQHVIEADETVRDVRELFERGMRGIMGRSRVEASAGSMWLGGD